MSHYSNEYEALYRSQKLLEREKKKTKLQSEKMQKAMKLARELQELLDELK